MQSLLKAYPSRNLYYCVLILFTTSAILFSERMSDVCFDLMINTLIVINYFLLLMKSVIQFIGFLLHWKLKSNSKYDLINK